MTATFESLNPGDTIDGPKFAVSRESIRLFCDASLDYNPLHLDDDYMKGDFGKTNFGGIIMHGMNNFGLISRMITDWAYPARANGPRECAPDDRLREAIHRPLRHCERSEAIHLATVRKNGLLRCARKDG